MRLLWIAALSVLLALPVLAGAAETRPLTPETLWQIQRLGPPALSPDGRQTVIPVTSFDVEADTSSTDLWIIPTDGGEARRLTTGGATAERPAWSPGGEHWEQPTLFAEVSPHTKAGNFDTPTLVIHGEQDYRVPLNHGLELFQTLQNRGVRSRLVYYPNENHWVLKGQNSIHWYHTKRDWLKEFIGAGP